MSAAYTVTTNDPLTIQYLVNFCQKEDFKGYVRQAINDEFFWRQLLDSHRVNTQISSYLANNIPSEVRKHLDYVLPGLISKEILTQLPVVVSNNFQMQKILEEHQSDLEQALEEAARLILNRVVNDPQYHEVNQAYFEAFKARGQKQIHEFNQQAQDLIEELKTNCQRELQELKAGLDNLTQYQERTANLERQITRIQYTLYGVGVLSIVLVGYLLQEHF